jgi:hypothetical protein
MISMPGLIGTELAVLGRRQVTASSDQDQTELAITRGNIQMRGDGVWSDDRLKPRMLFARVQHRLQQMEFPS